MPCDVSPVAMFFSSSVSSKIYIKQVSISVCIASCFSRSDQNNIWSHVSTQPTKLSWWSIKEWLAAQSLLTTDKQEVALPLGWGTACHRVCLFVGWTTQYHDPDASPVGEPVALQPPSLIKVLLRLSDCREIKHIKGKVKRIMHRWQTYKIVMHIPEGNDS